MGAGVEQLEPAADLPAQVLASELDEWPVLGEALDVSIERPVVDMVNSVVKNTPGENTFIDLGPLGAHNIKDVRFRDSAKQGFITAYTRTRETAADHKVITTLAFSAVAIGTVLTGTRALRHEKK